MLDPGQRGITCSQPCFIPLWATPCNITVQPLVRADLQYLVVLVTPYACPDSACVPAKKAHSRQIGALGIQLRPQLPRFRQHYQLRCSPS